MAASPSPRRRGLRRSLRSESGGPPGLRSRESLSPDHAASRDERGRSRRRGSSPVGGRSPSAGRGQRSGERGRSRRPRSRSNGPPALESRARSASRSPSSGPPALESHSPENARSRGEPGRGDDRRSRSPSASLRSASPDPFSATDAETRRIMQNRVVPSSRDQYEGQNIKFILWIFDDKDADIYVLHTYMAMTMTRSPQRKSCRCGSSTIAGLCTRAAHADARALAGRLLACRRWSARWALRWRRNGILAGSQVWPDAWPRPRSGVAPACVVLCRMTQHMSHVRTTVWA